MTTTMQTSTITNSDDFCPLSELVGKVFEREYYKYLHTSPNKIYEFYRESSVIWRPDDEANGVMTSVTTLQGITDKILSTDYKGYKAEIKTTDTYLSDGGGVNILITGWLNGKNNFRRKFIQSFFLAHRRSIKEYSFFILNDVLRYVVDPKNELPGSRMMTNPLPVLKQGAAPADETTTPLITNLGMTMRTTTTSTDPPHLIPFAEVVLNVFVKRYYDTFHQSPDLLYKFYIEPSVVCWSQPNGVMTSVTTIQAIKDKFLSMDYMKAEIETTDAYLTDVDGEFIFLITGWLNGKDDFRRKFVRSVFLKFIHHLSDDFILEDVLRYVDEKSELLEIVNPVPAAVKSSIESAPLRTPLTTDHAAATSNLHERVNELVTKVERSFQIQ
ncbi:Nuclear transport factor 2 [Macleaya cordata]|uniref:Nuclear transport factor 2 n=1 Tax=Macleaya cordata TaxID=56857 RepID=A0A200PRI4_MACCD|nr:Nuclear transport factor 2 [Macleaya cordata]